MVVEEGGGLSGRHGLRLTRESGDVGENDGCLAGDRFLDRGFAVAHESAHQVARHVGLEPAQARDHGVEGLRRIGDLGEEADGEPRHTRERQVAHLLRGAGQAVEGVLR